MRRSLQSAIFLLLQVLFKTKNQTLPWLQDVYCYNWFPPFWWNLYFSKLMTLIRFILLFYHQHWPNQVENKLSRKNPLISFVLDSDWCWVLKQWDVNWKYKSLNEFSGFFSFSFISPLFFKHKVLLNQDEYFEIYLLLLTAEDGWCFHTWSGEISCLFWVVNILLDAESEIPFSFRTLWRNSRWSCVLQWKAIFQFLLFKSLQYLE